MGVGAIVPILWQTLVALHILTTKLSSFLLYDKYIWFLLGGWAMQSDGYGCGATSVALDFNKCEV